MKMVVLDPAERKRIIQERQRTGADRYDEVWNGVYVMSPLADNQHQRLAYGLAKAIDQAIGDRLRAEVFTGTNVSDRKDNWKKNYRCPDFVIFLNGNPAKDLETHWLGGPDFAVEILSPRDRSRKKLPFYAKVGVHELLLIDRKPWTLELYRSREETPVLVGKSAPETSDVLTSEVLPLTFRLLPGDPRPQVELTRAGGDQRWLI